MTVRYVKVLAFVINQLLFVKHVGQLYVLWCWYNLHTHQGIVSMLFTMKNFSVLVTFQLQVTLTRILTIVMIILTKILKSLQIVSVTVMAILRLQKYELFQRLISVYFRSILNNFRKIDLVPFCRDLHHFDYGIIYSHQ